MRDPGLLQQEPLSLWQACLGNVPLLTCASAEDTQTLKGRSGSVSVGPTAFQRIVRRDKKAFLSGQCKEIEENNRMGKTRDLFKKIRYQGNISCKDGLNKGQKWYGPNRSRRYQEEVAKMYRSTIQKRSS